MSTSDKKTQSVGLSENQLRRLLDSLDSVPSDSRSQARRSNRIQYRSLNVIIHILSHRREVEKSFSAATRNLSAHGLAFLYKQMLAQNQMIRVEVPMLDGEVLEVNAKVIRCRHLKGMVHEIGVEFTGKGVRRAMSKSGLSATASL